jgi:hypothetical protein
MSVAVGTGNEVSAWVGAANVRIKWAGVAIGIIRIIEVVGMR